MEDSFGKLTRMMKAELGPLHERISRMEVSNSGNKHRSRTKGQRKYDDEYEMKGEEKSQNENWGGDGRDKGLDRIKALHGR